MITDLNLYNALKYKVDILRCLSDGFGDTEVTDEFFLNYCADQSRIERTHTLMYLVKDKPVSILKLLIEPKLIHNGSFVGHIEDVCTKSEHRHSGYSTMLISYACELARDLGCYKVILDSKLDGFYEKLGFKSVEKCYRKDL